MKTYNSDTWIPLCRRMIEAGQMDVPNGRIVDSVSDGSGKVKFLIEFNTPEDELMFVLRWE